MNTPENTELRDDPSICNDRLPLDWFLQEQAPPTVAGCFWIRGNGFWTLVDEASVKAKPRIMAPRWQKHKTKTGAYAVARMFDANGKHTSFLLHRIITGANPGEQVDHRNHNGLDNRLCNLRICSQSQNQANKRKLYGRSRFKGVIRDGKSGKWVARIGVNKKKYTLGRFENEIDAAKAYDAAAIEHFGEFACTNLSATATK